MLFPQNPVGKTGSRGEHGKTAMFDTEDEDTGVCTRPDMLRTRTRYVVTVMFVAAAILPGASTLYATVTVGGSGSSPYIWANPFSNLYTTTNGFGGSTGTGVVTALPGGLVDRAAGRVQGDGSSDLGAGYVYVTGTPYYTGSAWLKDTLNSGTFTAGGVISVQHYYSTSFTGTEPYTVSLGATQVQGPIAGDLTTSNKYQLNLFASPVTANSVRVDFPSMPVQSGNNRSYAGVQEALLLPVVGSRIPIATAGVTSTTDANGFLGSYAVDNDEFNIFYSGATATSIVTVDLGTVGLNDKFDLGTLVVCAIDNHGATFTLLGSSNGGSSYSPLLGGQTVAYGSTDIAILNINAAGLDHIQFATGIASGIDEIFAFQPAPEPTSLSLLALGALALLRRRK